MWMYVYDLNYPILLSSEKLKNTGRKKTALPGASGMKSLAFEGRVRKPSSLTSRTHQEYFFVEFRPTHFFFRCDFFKSGLDSVLLSAAHKTSRSMRTCCHLLSFAVWWWWPPIYLRTCRGVMTDWDEYVGIENFVNIFSPKIECGPPETYLIFRPQITCGCCWKLALFYLHCRCHGWLNWVAELYDRQTVREMLGC